MKVLIISHTVLSQTEAMGKTLLSYFSSFQSEEVAQLYLRDEIPIVRGVCGRYYRISDTDALRARLPGLGCGQEFDDTQAAANPVSKVTEELYQYGRKRTPMIYLLRNLIWKTAFWKTNKLKQWIRDFAPDVIFFAAGDYAFSYEIALWAAELTKKPLVISCVDDFYCNNINKQSILGRLQHRNFLQTVRRTMARASCLFTICDEMTETYSAMFQKPCHTLHTASVPRIIRGERRRQLSYLGNLGHGRNLALEEMGRALRALSLPEGPTHIDVYSTERRPEILAAMTEENGIVFHGSVEQTGVAEIMDRSMAVIHVESFDGAERERVRMSISTKVADSLMNGPCLIAYGPEDVASIAYLKKNEAAVVISEPEKIQSQLRAVLTDTRLRSDTEARARALAKQNHLADRVSPQVRAWLEEVTEP